jgi:multiple sugar transport system permease protein
MSSSTTTRVGGRQSARPGSPGKDAQLRPRRARSGPATNGRSGYWFILPAALTMLLLIAYPLLYGFYISGFDTNLINRWDFVGVRYYTEAFADPAFRKSLGTTLLYAVSTVAGTLVVGTGLALVLNREMRFRTVFRAILILPWLFPEVVVALVWKWMFNPIYGLFNYILQGAGLSSDPIQWLDDPNAALPGVVIASVWKGYPLVMILILAGLQSIPRELYEAAAIDGGNGRQLFRHITLPGLAPVMLVTVILETVWWFKHFTIVWLLTSGGPVDATNVVSIDIYRTAFQNFDFGRAAASAVIVFFICLLISVVYRRVLPDDK